MYRSIKRFIEDESGSVALDYGIIGAGIFIAFVAILATLGAELRQIVSNSKNDVDNVDNAPK